MKKFKFAISGEEYDVHIQDIEDNIAQLEVNGTKYEVEIKHELKITKTPILVRKPVVHNPGEGQIKKQPVVSSGTFTVKAPLPGTILTIKVKLNDTIKKGQSLLVMEAMKMENEVMSEKDGTVAAIKIKEGDAVLQDDVLIELS